ncbi:MAG TPA: hypothetical protein PLD46_06155, partial [Hyphomicrobium sp.]|nr:hypothetical protein [Hyphomicrobium sp.]
RWVRGRTLLGLGMVETTLATVQLKVDDAAKLSDKIAARAVDSALLSNDPCRNGRLNIDVADAGRGT